MVFELFFFLVYIYWLYKHDSIISCKSMMNNACPWVLEYFIASKYEESETVEV